MNITLPISSLITKVNKMKYTSNNFQYQSELNYNGQYLIK
jgi:hypothetical protein